MRLALILLLSLPNAAFAKGPLELEELGDEKYTEQVVAIADLSDGTYAKLLFGVSNVGPGDGKGACELFVSRPSGQVLTAHTIVERDQRVSEPERLKIGPCEARAGEALVMTIPLDGINARLTLYADTRKSRESALSVRAKDDFYQLDLLVPWAKAELILEKDGKTERLTGFGYADHPRSKILPGDLAKGWVRFRSLKGGDSRVAVIRQSPKSEISGWYRDQKGRKVEVQRLMVQRSGQAFRVRFAGEGGEWRITSGPLIRRNAPLESNGVLGSMAKAIIGNPVTYELRATLEERGSTAKVPGILEVTITDE